jgi:hypothetical protein
VLSEVRRIGGELGAGDIIVFFFAGHGKTISSSDQLFLLPDVSARALESGVVAGEGVLSYRGLRAETDSWAGV